MSQTTIKRPPSTYCMRHVVRRKDGVTEYQVMHGNRIVKRYTDEVKANLHLDVLLWRASKYFLASYEDRAKVQAKVNELPEDERDESWVEVANSDPAVRTYQRFPDLETATGWLTLEIALSKTVFGCGSIDEIMVVERRDQCRHCDCRGKRCLRSWIHDGDSADERSGSEHECCD